MVKLRVKLLGTGAAILAESRAKSSVYVECGSTRILIDAGPPLQQRLYEENIDPAKINFIIITHIHQDHLFGLPGFMYEIEASGVKEPPKLIVPRDSLEDVEFLLKNYGPKRMKYTFRTMKGDQGVLEIDSIKVRYYRVKHPLPTYALKLEFKDTGLFYSSDTMYMKELEDMASTTIAIHEATIPVSLEDKAWEIGGHSSPRQALRVIRNAEYRILTHLTKLSFKGYDYSSADFIIASDGLEIIV